MENDKMKLSPPWVTYFHKVQALFEKDDSVTVDFDEKNCCLNIIVKEDVEKGEAIQKLFPSEKVFGNNVMKINVITIMEEKQIPTAQIFAYAFCGNPIVEDIINASDILRDDQTYIMFQNKVVQFFNDDIYDYNGVCTTLYQDIAKDVFKDFADVHYCTSTNINTNKEVKNTNIDKESTEKSNNKITYDDLAGLIEAFWYGY